MNVCRSQCATACLKGALNTAAPQGGAGWYADMAYNAEVPMNLVQHAEQGVT
jgi:hypothetical protein